MPKLQSVRSKSKKLDFTDWLREQVLITELHNQLINLAINRGADHKAITFDKLEQEYSNYLKGK